MHLASVGDRALPLVIERVQRNPATLTLETVELLGQLGVQACCGDGSRREIASERSTTRRARNITRRRGRGSCGRGPRVIHGSLAPVAAAGLRTPQGSTRSAARSAPVPRGHDRLRRCLGLTVGRAAVFPARRWTSVPTGTGRTRGVADRRAMGGVVGWTLAGYRGARLRRSRFRRTIDRVIGLAPACGCGRKRPALQRAGARWPLIQPLPLRARTRYLNLRS